MKMASTWSFISSCEKSALHVPVSETHIHVNHSTMIKIPTLSGFLHFLPLSGPAPGLCAQRICSNTLSTICFQSRSHSAAFPFYTGASCTAFIFRTTFHGCSLPEELPTVNEFQWFLSGTIKEQLRAQTLESALPFTSCATLGKGLNLSDPYFSHL